MLNLVSERTIEQRMLGTLASKQALSEGVLDQRGDLGAIKMVGGRENFAPTPRNAAALAEGRAAEPGARQGTREIACRRRARPVADGHDRAHAPADRPREFCQGAVELLNGALVSCEERFPARGDASVLLVVVESDADRWREKLRPLGAPVSSGNARRRTAAGGAAGGRGPRHGRPAAAVGGIGRRQPVVAGEPRAVPVRGGRRRGPARRRSKTAPGRRATSTPAS